MSRYDVVAKEPDKYTVTVGWDRPLQTYFAQVIHRDSDRDYDMALWKGTNPREIGSVAELQQALKDYADIPKETCNTLEWDRGMGGVTAHEFIIESSRDKQAVSAYEADCRQRGEVPTDDGRKRWVREWHEINRLLAAGMETQQRPAERDVDNDMGR